MGICKKKVRMDYVHDIVCITALSWKIAERKSMLIGVPV
jgi:hypothetical protein